MNTQQLLSTAGAARELGVSEQWIRKLLKRGRIAGAFKVGRDWLIPMPIHVLTARQRAGGGGNRDHNPLKSGAMEIQ